MASQLIMLYTCTHSYFNCMYSCTVVYTISLELSVHSYTLLLTETLCEIVQTLAGYLAGMTGKPKDCLTIGSQSDNKILKMF